MKKLEHYFKPNPPKAPQISILSIPQGAYLRLPHHTRQLWQFSKVLLMMIATKQSCTVESIIETICQLIKECRILRPNEIDVSILMEYLNRRESPGLLDIFAKIASYALEVEFLFPNPFPILTKQNNLAVNISSIQVRCLLALQFFCCFPKQETRLDMPRDYTYAKIFNKSHADVDSQIAKIDCAVNYFNRQINPNEYYITFARKFISNFPDWQNLDVPMSKVYLLNQTNGTEDFRDKIMIDFANKYIGGGALSSGTVQEEIMFHKHVEPIVSILFTEKLEDEEALLIKGTQRFNETKGYKSEFRFVGDFTESVIYDDYNRNDSIIVAIDATYYQGMEHLQYQKNHILREINKAYVGFLGDAEDNVKRDIVTGRWGCGAFAGDEQLKFIIQWIAASATGRDMYFLLWNMKDVSGLDQFIQNAMGFNAKNIYNAIVLAGRCENLLTAVTRILHS